MNRKGLSDSLSLESRFASEELTVEVWSGGGWFSKLGWEQFGYALSRELAERCRYVNALVSQLADIPNVEYSFQLAHSMRYPMFVAKGLSMSWLLRFVGRLHGAQESMHPTIRSSLIRPDWRSFGGCTSMELKFTDRDQAFEFQVTDARHGALGVSVLFDAVIHAMRAGRRDNRTRLFLVVRGSTGKQVMRFSAYGSALDAIFGLSNQGREETLRRKVI